MLISLAVENFKSFDKMTVFNMIASNKLRGEKERIYNKDGIRILKSAVIYGANASGKSNLIDVFRFMRQCILSKEGFPLKTTQVYCKNNPQNEQKISTFEIRMCIHETCYAYGFDILLKDKSIKSEWVLALKKADEVHVLFKREKHCIEIGESIILDPVEKVKFQTYADDLSENDTVLFLSEMNRNKRISKNSQLYFFKEIYEWFENDLHIFSPDTPLTNFEYYYDTNSLEIVKQIMKSFDTGISDIRIKQITVDELRNKISKELFTDIMHKVEAKTANTMIKQFRLSMRSKDEFFNITKEYQKEEPLITTLSFKHGNSYCDFDFDEESDGTKRIFDLLDILLTENKNSVYVIDEMERSLHPSLTKHFIELLNEYQKKSNIQLIFTTHEATIMTQELFRRDQIWFVSRDQWNNSNVYPLDVFNERYDKKISKAYLEGRYGAIPVFKDFITEEVD